MAAMRIRDRGVAGAASFVLGYEIEITPFLEYQRRLQDATLSPRERADLRADTRAEILSPARQDGP
jgi:hypothetical protein